MTKSNLFFAIMISFALVNMTAATASASETFSLYAFFGVTKCTKLFDENDKEKIECKGDGGAGGNVTIELNHCNEIENGTSCWGEWLAEQSIDGHSFKGSLSVSKWTGKDGQEKYEIATHTKRVDADESGSVHILNLATNSLSDTSILIGNIVRTKDSTGNEVSLIPAVGVAPQNKKLGAALVSAARHLVTRTR